MLKMNTKQTRMKNITQHSVHLQIFCNRANIFTKETPFAILIMPVKVSTLLMCYSIRYNLKSAQLDLLY